MTRRELDRVARLVANLEAALQHSQLALEKAREVRIAIADRHPRDDVWLSERQVRAIAHSLAQYNIDGDSVAAYLDQLCSALIAAEVPFSRMPFLAEGHLRAADVAEQLADRNPSDVFAQRVKDLVYRAVSLGAAHTLDDDNNCREHGDDCQAEYEIVYMINDSGVLA